MASIDINGVMLDYSDRGKGTPIVLLHGFPLDSRIFSKQLDLLSVSHRVITPDLCGFGRSRSERQFSIASLADDVHHLLQKIDALPCVLGGLSMGGYVALAYVRKYPNDLKGLVLIDTRAEGDTPEGKTNRQKMADLARSDGSKPVADQMFPKMLSPKTVEDQQHIAAMARSIMEMCPPRTIEHACFAMRDRDDFTEELPSVAVPTLIIVGEDDAITPPGMSRQMNQQIPRSELCIIKNAGHLSAMEQPEEVSSRIDEFVTKIEQGAQIPHAVESVQSGVSV
jgi:3-oxoadipate enol-lactonase